MPTCKQKLEVATVMVGKKSPSHFYVFSASSFIIFGLKLLWGHPHHCGPWISWPPTWIPRCCFEGLNTNNSGSQTPQGYGEKNVLLILHVFSSNVIFPIILLYSCHYHCGYLGPLKSKMLPWMHCMGRVRNIYPAHFYTHFQEAIF